MYSKALFSRSKRGAALIEYGILVGLIAVIAIPSVLVLGEGVENTFNTVTTQLSSNIGNTPAPAAGPEPLPTGIASATFIVGDRGSWASEYGWSQASVDVNAGTLLASTSASYEIVTIYTQGFGGEMRLYLAGDVSGDDFTGISLNCGGRDYDLENADNFTKDYRPADNATFWLWQGADPVFVVGEEQHCFIE